MAKGFKKGAYYPLNFKLVGNPQPETAKENTIWIDTDVPITGWMFSVSEPEPPTDGLDGPVWIYTGTSSAVKFSATKKNSIMVYPISVKQFAGGAWVDKTAKSFQNGEWVDWNTYLYNAGNEYSDVTGGWTLKANAGMTAKKLEDSIFYDITGGTQRDGWCYTTKPVDLTGFKTLTAKVNIITNGGTGCYFRFGASKNVPSSTTFTHDVYTQTQSKGEMTVKVDISTLTAGSYYIGMGFVVSDGYVYEVALHRKPISEVV